MKKLVLIAIAISIPWALSALDDPVSSEMATGARQFLDGLEKWQQGPVTFGFEDEERFDWHYIPRERQGLPLKSMSPAQRLLAHRLLATGLSPRGLQQSLAIMYLDQVLFEKERRAIRDPDLYYFTVFGEPSTSGDWGFRVEGHHLSLNVTLRDGRLASTSPFFMGANPATVPDGAFQGMRALAAEETLGRELLQSFDDVARDVIVIESEAPRDVVTAASRTPEIGAPRGLSYQEMSPAQRELVMGLVELYATRLRAEIASGELARIRNDGLDAIHFAWAGGAEPGEGHYYRIQGPSFLIEYDNTQNDANHIHTVWRDLSGGDFGGDPLADHYAKSPHHHGTHREADHP